MAEFTECPNEVIDIAGELIRENHPWLDAARIGFIFREEAATSKGKTVFVQVRRPPAWFQVFDEYDFIVEIAENVYSGLSSERREAMIDFALSHCILGKNGWAIRAYDFEGFDGNIRRYGFWNQDLLQAAVAFRDVQLEFPEMSIGVNGGELKRIDPLALEGAALKASDEAAT